MTSDGGRHGRMRASGVAAALVACLAVAASGAEPLPGAGTTGVWTSGVPGDFAATRAAVTNARDSSGREYRVVVVDSAGDAGDVRGLLDRLVARWRDEAGANRGGFDPAADVTVVVDTGDRQIAMLVPWAVEVSAGLDPETLERELIEKVFVPRAKDGLFDEGLAELVTATEGWVRARADEKAARVEAARVFRTRTLPLAVAGITAAGLLGALAAQRWRHARRLAAAREKLGAFKAEVVALSDLLDAQQERHRMLPHTDPDFRTPMEGLTRNAYDDVQGAIRRYRERWLGLMDVWEKAQQTIDAEWFLGTAAADDAVRLLDSAEARPPLDEVAGAVRGPLDTLEGAHETARGLLEKLDADLAATNTRFDGLARRGRAAGFLQPTLGEVARGRAAAAADVERDPVAARGALEQAAATLAGATARIAAIEAADDRRARATAQADEIERKIAARRAEGWRLAEDGANPDAHVAAARKECDLAAQLLDAGETAAALDRLAAAEQATGEAAALLESIEVARGRVEELLAPTAARLEALAARRGAAASALEHLAAHYAENAWSDVADNPRKADEGLARASALVVEARAAAAIERQHYFRAVALLEEAGRQADWVESLMSGATDRAAELDSLAARLPARGAAVRERVAALEGRLVRQRTDRARANERCREAGRILEVARQGLTAARPDPLEARELVEAADAAAARGEELADEDERLAKQAVADLEETDALVRRAAAWYAEGVQADVRGAESLLTTARSLLERQRYEDAIASAGEANLAARAAYAAATAEADRRRARREQEARRRQLEESFTRMTRGAGPWVIQLPGGVFTGPDPWRSLQSGTRPGAAPASRTAGGGWGRDVAQVRW